MSQEVDKVNQIVLKYLEKQGFQDAAKSLENQINNKGVQGQSHYLMEANVCG